MTPEIKINNNDLLIMNLVHYFITEKNYNPVILHGINDEIWLENLDNDYKIVRIVSHYIHNNEQLSFDKFKLKRILSNLKKRTFSVNMPIVSIYTSLGEGVELVNNDNNDLSILISKLSEVNNDNLLEIFPDIVEKTTHKEKGIDLFVKISDDINKESYQKSQRVEKIFAPKKPIITYLIMAICITMFVLSFIIGNGPDDVKTLIKMGANNGYYTRNGEYFRLLTCIFLHAGFIHIICNMYSLFVIGPQVESFYGKIKYLFIFLFSGICGSVLSLGFASNNLVSVGASGAIFGLLGSILYFGYHYRVYLGNALKSQIIPVIILNLFIGFAISGIDNFAHIGGLIGGVFASMAVGVPDKSSTSDKANGCILMLIYLMFIVYLAFFK
jgi:rhomboid protease GluP